ncbi:MAG: glycerophosphodiester phosphodiesterase [Gemmatimonadaceae bacterium]|nr:glycerophosphodiester phosphodiesterase [Gemmatimonadaceae bacterium]
MTGIPKIIAHRGAPREALENTLLAFRIALDQEADGIELDVHATKDGVVVVHHDPAVRVLDDGVSRVVPICELTAAEAIGLPLAGGATMPTLDETLAFIGARAVVYIEVKSAGIEGPLIDCLDRHQGSRLAIHAFDHRIPVAVRAKRPDLPIGLLSTSYPLSLAGFLGGARPTSLWQQAHLIDAALVTEAHELGTRVVAWTVNDVVHARALIAMGVDALCTDTPGLLRTALGA